MFMETFFNIIWLALIAFVVIVGVGALIKAMTGGA